MIFAEQIGAFIEDLYCIVEMTPSLLSTIRRHLPRQRLLRACFDMAFSPSDDLREWAKDEDNLGGGSPHIRGAWMFLDALQKMARVDGQCIRRGCKRRRSGRCKTCQTADYCDVQCQAQCVFIHFNSDGSEGREFTHRTM